MDDPRARFAALAARADAAIPLDEAALLIAQEHYPNLVIEAERRRLDELAACVAARTANLGDSERLTAMADVLGAEKGFRGNTEDYYDLRNSFLNDVLERRTGIPITLSVIYLEVARRIHLPLVGVNFPGHFLIRYPGPGEPAVLDAFASGARLSRAQLRERLGRALGSSLDPRGGERMLDDLLKGTGPRAILVRMLTNLKRIFLKRQDLPSALGAMDRILLLTPTDPDEIRDRAVLYQHLECFSAALGDYRRWLELCPDDPRAGEIRATVLDLQQRARLLH